MARLDLVLTVSGYIEANNTEEAEQIIEDVKNQIVTYTDLIWPHVELDYVGTTENQLELTID